MVPIAGDLGMDEWEPHLATMELVVGTGNKPENEYMYNTTSGGEKCQHLGGGKSDEEK